MYFYGAGEIGFEALELLRENYKNEKVAGFIHQGKESKDSNPIIFNNSVLEKLNNNEVIVVTTNSVNALEIVLLLKKYGFINIYWYARAKIAQGSSFIEDYCIRCDDWDETYLPYVEMHVTEMCNLNCKGCTHYAALFDENEEFDRIEDIRLLRTKIDNIIEFRLLGGEPFLEHDISIYIDAVKENYPLALLTITTNGLLIPTVKEHVLEKVKKNNVILAISEYEPTKKIMKQIVGRLDAYDISFFIMKWDKKQLFNLPLTTNRNTVLQRKCISNGCVNIWKGKIARCPSLMYLPKLNSSFSLHFPEGGIIDLQDDISKAELLEMLRQRVDLCDYCVECPIKWERCDKKPKYSDFVTDK